MRKISCSVSLRIAKNIQIKLKHAMLKILFILFTLHWCLMTLKRLFWQIYCAIYFLIEIYVSFNNYHYIFRLENVLQLGVNLGTILCSGFF